MTEKRGPPTRSGLLSLLSEACELEHGLACSYLYTAFTLKQDLSEGGLTWRQLQLVRTWAAQIYFVAAQEMLHLALAWNLLAAVGGTPYYLRPNFPQAARYYPLGRKLVLEPFGTAALDRFIHYEKPAEVPLEALLARPEAPRRPLGAELPHDDEPAGYRSVGELYGLIADAISAIPERELFIGRHGQQVGPDTADFPELVKVTDRASALRAIDEITRQGEGTEIDRIDCHYGIFRRIEAEFVRETAASAEAGRPFVPARPSLTNPVPRRRGDWGGADGGTVIKDPYARAAADLFDDVYGLMLRMLQFVFANETIAPNVERRLAQYAIALMPTVVKPLGEALTLLPDGSGEEGGGERLTAGPAFGLTRHVPLSASPEVATALVNERFRELTAAAAALAADSRAPRQLAGAAANLDRLGRRLSDGLDLHGPTNGKGGDGMANAIHELGDDGRTVGHFGFRQSGEGIEAPATAIHDGDTIFIRAIGNFSVRFLGVDTPEVAFKVPDTKKVVPTSDAAWTRFLTDPFDPKYGEMSLPAGLAQHLRDRLGPKAGPNHAALAACAQQALLAEVEKDRAELGKSVEEFRFFLEFSRELLDRYGRFLAYVKADQPKPKPGERRKPSYNERMLESGLAAPYFIWPNVDPFIKQDKSLPEAVPEAGTAATVGQEGALGRARAAVRKARDGHAGIFDKDEPLLIQPFELRFLADRRAPNRWLIDLSRNDDTLIPPTSYYEVANVEDRLYVSPDHLPLFEKKGWRLRQ